MIRTACFLLLALVLVVPAAAQNWELVWSDEFDYTGLPDPAKWTHEVGGSGWGNNELQFYTENDLDNASVADGVLTITALKESMSGRDYTSARLVTRDKGEWTYGRFEIRAKLPTGRGTWPALWLLYAESNYGGGGWPDNGEIDIMEHVGFDPGVVHATIHTAAFNHGDGTQVGSQTTVPDFDTEFHTYALEWGPQRLEAFVDDTKYFTFENQGTGWEAWPFDQPMFMILNIAVGGDWGGAQGIDDTIFPAAMQIDYVRVYQDPQAQPTVALTSPAASGDFDEGGTITLSADAADAGGTIDHVAFLQGDGVLGIDTEAPYTVDVENVQAGCYQVRARAVDADGYEQVTEPLAITVGNPATCERAPYLMAAQAVPGDVEAEYFDLGGEDVAYNDFTTGNDGGDWIRTDENVDIEPTLDLGGGFNVTNISRREWLEYTLDVQEAGKYTLDVRVAGNAGGSFDLSLEGEAIAETETFNDTGGEQQWSIARISNVILEEGLQTLRFTANTTGFNFNKITFRFISSVSTEDGAALPQALRLEEAYPNPLRDRATLSYQLAEAGFARLAVYDVLGRRVATLVERVQPAGPHTATFDASALAGGFYLAVLETTHGRRTQRLVVTR